MKAALSADRMYPTPEKKCYTKSSGFSLHQTGPVLQMDTWIITLINFSSTELCNHGPRFHFSGNMFELKKGGLALLLFRSFLTLG